jgi:Amt family ammonium transporter
VNAMGLLRVSAEGEIYGLDLHEHGIPAYPEYVISALGSPAGAGVASSLAHAPAPHAVLSSQPAS